MTKTHAETTPSDTLTAWRKAFFTKDANAFAEGICDLGPLLGVKEEKYASLNPG